MIESKTRARTLINVIGMPSLLAIIYYGGNLFTAFIYLVIFLCTYELKNISSIKGYSFNLSFLYIIYSFMFLSYFLDFSSVIINVILLFLCMVLFILELYNKNKFSLENISITLLVFIWIACFLDKAIYLRYLDNGFQIMLSIFLSVWVCDSAAFIVGTKLGNRKIAPSISPNKTWEGTIAGFIFSTLFIYFLVQNQFLQINNYLFTINDVFIMGFIIGVIGQLGDLFESMIKREFGVKDSGTLLQGHGGVLDRFDSLLFTIPAFYIYLKLII